jgi:hypothetical protein
MMIPTTIRRFFDTFFLGILWLSLLAFLPALDRFLACCVVAFEKNIKTYLVKMLNEKKRFHNCTSYRFCDGGLNRRFRNMLRSAWQSHRFATAFVLIGRLRLIDLVTPWSVGRVNFSFWFNDNSSHGNQITSLLRNQILTVGIALFTAMIWSNNNAPGCYVQALHLLLYLLYYNKK